MLRSLREYRPDDFVKLTLDDNCDRYTGFQFKEGLNIDIYPLSGDECDKGGFCFCRYRDINYWFRRYFDAHIWRVKIPDGEKIIDFGNKLKAHKIILYDCRNFYEIDELCQLAVGTYPYFMEYVRVKTPLLCQIAVENRNTLPVRNYVKKLGLLIMD